MADSLFPEYRSLFVDPGIDEATKDLVQRYYKNMEYSDVLGQKLNELQNAPFEGDANINNELKSTINTNLEDLAGKGRYEHYEQDLRGLGMRFNKTAPLIAQNKANYDKTMQDLKESVDNERINAEQYNLGLIYQTYGYEGLKKDDKGDIDRSSLFSGKHIYSDPKIYEMLHQRFQDLVIRDYNVKDSRVGIDKDGKWTYSTEEGQKFIKDEDIKRIVASIKNDPSVSMYINQLGDLTKTAYAAKGGGVEYLNSVIDNTKSTITAYETAKASEKNKDVIAQYDELIKSLNTDLTNLQNTVASNDPTKILDMISDVKIQLEYNKIDEYAKIKKGIISDVRGTARDNDLYAYRQREEAARAAAAVVSLQGMVTAAEDGTGTTVEEKRNTLNDYGSVINNLQEQLKDPNLSDDLKSTYESQLRYYQTSREELERTLKVAANEAITLADLEKQDPTLIGVLKDFYGTNKGGDIYTYMQTTFDNVGDQDYMDFEKAFNSKYGNGALQKHMQEYYGGSVSDREAIKRANPNVTEEELNAYNITNASGVLRKFNKFTDKVNDKFKELKTSSLYSNQIIMPDVVAQENATDGINEHFQTMTGSAGRSLLSSEQVIVAEGDEVGQTKYGDAYAGYKISKWMYSPENDDFLLVLNKTDDNKTESVTVRYPGKQIRQVEGVDWVKNQPARILGGETSRLRAGLKEGESIRKDGFWEIQGIPLDYQITKKDGEDYIEFYESGKVEPLPIDTSPKNASKTKYKLDDDALDLLIEKGLTPTYSKKIIYGRF
jgi:hypothetical protein